MKTISKKNFKKLQVGEEVKLKEVTNVSGERLEEHSNVEGVVKAVQDLQVTVQVAMSDGRVSVLEIALIADKLVVVAQRFIEQSGFFKRLFNSIKSLFKRDA